ncbi:MAG: hypothetical protein EAZ32_01290, partial [Cytophagia bacterium]
MFGSLAYAQNITATLTPAISTCQANGTITISNVNGGTCTPYKYALISGPNVLQPPVYQDAPVLTGLQAGTYAVSIIDCDGNEKTFSMIVVGGNYQIMNFTLAPTLTPCTNGTPPTGTVTVNGLTGGNPPYRYRIFTPTTGAFQTSGIFNNLTPGTTYQIQVWDACDNFQTRQVQIPNISGVSLSNPSYLFENCDGTVKTTFTTSGGTPVYTYRVTAGPTLVNTTNTTGIFNFNTAGSYTVTTTDQCGSVSTRTFTTPGAPTQELFAQGTQASNCNNMGGGINIVVRGGIAPYTGTLKGLAGTSCAGTNITLNLVQSGSQYVQVVTGLTRPCTYVVEVIDKCGNITTRNVDLVPGGAEQLGNSDEIQCPSTGSNNYNLKIGASFGPPYSPTLPFTFDLKNSSNVSVTGFPRTQSGNEVTVALAPGTYTYQITDACGTTSKTITKVIPTYTPPTLSVDLTNACINAGQAKLNFTNGNQLNPTFKQFKITAGPDRVNETNTTGIFSNLRGNSTYTFEFFDGCRRVTTTGSIPGYTQPTFEVASGVICPPATVACLQAVGLKGSVVQPYKFEIIALNTTGGITRPEQSDSTFCNLSAGQYNIRGFDGCNNSFTFLGKIGPIPTPRLLITPNAACEGEPTRFRTEVLIFGATYTILRDGVTVYTGPKGINFLPAITGSYTIRTEVSGGCNATSPAVVLVTKGKLFVTNPAAVCEGTTVNLTAAAITAGSDAGTLTYWKDANATVALDAASGPATAIQLAGDYYIKLTSSSPTCVAIKKVTVTFKPKPTVSATGGKLTCTVTSLNLSATANPSTSTYSWTGPSITAGANTATPTINQPGTYTVKATLDGCERTATATVTQDIVKPNATATGGRLTCTVTSINISAASTTAGVTYAWTGPGITSGANTASPTVNQPGSYVVTVTNPANGCTETATATVTQDI